MSTTDTDPSKSRSDPPVDTGPARTDTIARLIADHTHDGIALHDIRGRTEWANPAYLRLFGYTLAEISGRNPLAFALPPEDRPNQAAIDAFVYDLEADFDGGYKIVENLRKDGTRFWNQLSFGVVQVGDGGENTKVIVSCRDVTDQVRTDRALRQAKAKIEHAASHDDLTGLANRKGLTAYLHSDAVADAIRQRRIGILQLDLDLFKNINDRLGHDAGDAALVHVARTLARLAEQPGNLACRIGGDEFQLVCMNVDSPGDLLKIAQTIATDVARPIRLEGRDVRLSVSIGAAMASDLVHSGFDLMKQADQALYNVKHSGRGEPELYTEALGQTIRDRNQLVTDLRRGLKEQQFEMFFQPQLDLAQDRVIGVEALMRWRHPRRGLLAPNEFLDAAEQNRVLSELDFVAMNAALDAQVALAKGGFTDLKMSINVSGDTLTDPRYPNLLDWAIQSRDLMAHRVCIEVLESVVLQEDDPLIVPSIEKLKRLGVQIALDDFGTGYAGLSQLSQFDIDQIKLDRSMIIQLDRGRRGRLIVSAIARLCAELGVRVVAEGVETTRQLQVLRGCGCPMIQGFGLGRPMPLDVLSDWLAEFRDRRAPFDIASPGTRRLGRRPS